MKKWLFNDSWGQEKATEGKGPKILTLKQMV